MTDLSGPTSLNTSSSATASASSAPKKTKSNASSKSKKPTGTSSHPKYSDMIKQALSQLNERLGASKAAILKYILANFKDFFNSLNKLLL